MNIINDVVIFFYLVYISLNVFIFRLNVISHSVSLFLFTIKPVFAMKCLGLFDLEIDNVRESV